MVRYSDRHNRSLRFLHPRLLMEGLAGIPMVVVMDIAGLIHGAASVAMLLVLRLSAGRWHLKTAVVRVRCRRSRDSDKAGRAVEREC